MWLAKLSLGKECCSPLSRRLWWGTKYELPQERLRGRLAEGVHDCGNVPVKNNANRILFHEANWPILFIMVEVIIQPQLTRTRQPNELHYGGLVKTRKFLSSFFASLTYAFHSLIELYGYPFILYFIIEKKNSHSKTSLLCNFGNLKLNVRKSEKNVRK